SPPIPPQTRLLRARGPPADTSSGRCRGHLQRGAGEHAPKRNWYPPRSRRARAPCSTRPCPSTTAPPARAKARPVAIVWRVISGTQPGSSQSATLAVNAVSAWLPPRLRRKPARCLFDDGAEREQRLFLERPSDELQTQRQAVRVEPARHRNARQSGHVHGHGENVIEIHFDRIDTALFTDGKRSRRCRRSEDRVHASCEALLEVALDQRAHFLRPQIIRIIIAGGQHIGADHDAPAHFLAEAGGTGTLIHLDDVAAGNAQPISHAVITSEIRRSLSRRHDVVGWQRVLGKRQ